MRPVADPARFSSLEDVGTYAVEEIKWLEGYFEAKTPGRSIRGKKVSILQSVALHILFYEYLRWC